jgi:hypothetical protein
MSTACAATWAGSTRVPADRFTATPCPVTSVIRRIGAGAL